MRFRFAFASALLFSTIVASTSLAAVPDPSRSGCEYPDGSVLPCPDPISVNVTLRDAFDIPVANCGVTVFIIVESGALDDGQITSVSGMTDALGVATLTFPAGVLGFANVHFETHSTCIGDILICESSTYSVQCGGPLHIDPKTWGSVKSLYF